MSSSPPSSSLSHGVAVPVVNLQAMAKKELENNVKIQKSSTAADLVFGSMSFETLTVVSDGHNPRGEIAGVAGKLVEYPFDTIKVRLQTQPITNISTAPTFRGPLDCFLQTIRAEGFLGLYKGLTAPLIGAMIENSGLFFAYNQVQNLVRSLSSPSSSTLSSSQKKQTQQQQIPLTIPQLALCGFFSGALVSLILTPVELVKCKLQVQGLSLLTPAGTSSQKALKSPPQFRGPLDTLTHIIRHQGIRGLYKGHIGTFLRESGGGAAWFGTYEVVCKAFLGRREKNGEKFQRGKDDLSPWELMGAGALAGMCYNATLFPADVIKSRQQTMDPSFARSGFLQIAQDVYKAQGIKGFYRGCGITVARSAPTSAVTFATYELLNRHATIPF